MPASPPKPLGRYYLYFSHHAGKFIRLAYADALTGPWKIHEPGTLRIEEAPRCHDHIASPDVHIDEARREILVRRSFLPTRVACSATRQSMCEGDLLKVYYSRIGDRPERILVSETHLAPDWRAWRASPPVDVLSPERDYEGHTLPLEVSAADEAPDRVRQLRDPGIFSEGRRTYLVYSVRRGLVVTFYGADDGGRHGHELD